MNYSDAYVGEIRMFGGTFAPAGWKFCDGTKYPISSYQTLFSLIGTHFGGDGRTTFAVPDLRGRIPINIGQAPGFPDYPYPGIKDGAEFRSLDQRNFPNMTLKIPAYSGNATVDTPSPDVCLAKSNSSTATQHKVEIYSDQRADTTLKQVEIMGASVPIDIRQPVLSISFIIAMEGIYPSPS